MPNANSAGMQHPLAGARRWLCDVGYFIDENTDKQDFLDTVTEVIKVADGAVYYFREPSFFGDFYAAPNPKPETKIISMIEIPNLLPDMSDQTRYAIGG